MQEFPWGGGGLIARLVWSCTCAERLLNVKQTEEVLDVCQGQNGGGCEMRQDKEEASRVTPCCFSFVRIRAFTTGYREGVNILIIFRKQLRKKARRALSSSS
eukprot:Hpha_TRINITY_DN13990_c0_g1::TRINITY_DN13990_c0_g1_i1::g.35721::m.35721